MSIIKKTFIILALLFFSFSLLQSAHAQNKETHLYFFWSLTCPHCESEKKFLERISPSYPDLVIYSFEITKNAENRKLLQKLVLNLSLKVQTVPVIIIGDTVIYGYIDDESTGKQIENHIQKIAKEGDPDIVGTIIGYEYNMPILTETPTPAQKDEENIATQSQTVTGKETSSLPESIKIPIVGYIKLKQLSLPALTAILGVLDGFNPCAMWVLIFLISLLLGMKDRKRMWAIGGTFIAVSGFVYFLFLAAWLRVFLFLQIIHFVRIAVGIIAFIIGVYYIRDYYVNKDGTCKTVQGKKREKFLDAIRKSVQKESLLLTLIGISVIAAAVNLIELVCSAGLPAIYTQTLSLSKLPMYVYYAYLTLYIFFFMLDDLIIFAIAMKTLRAVSLSHRYSRFSRIAGGIIMFIIGILLIFKPELLMFG